MDALMVQLGCVDGQTNYYYFVKHGSTLDDCLYSFCEHINLEFLKDIVSNNKMIDVYVEIGKTRLVLNEMSACN